MEHIRSTKSIQTFSRTIKISYDNYTLARLIIRVLNKNRPPSHRNTHTAALPLYPRGKRDDAPSQFFRASPFSLANAERVCAAFKAIGAFVTTRAILCRPHHLTLRIDSWQLAAQKSCRRRRHRALFLPASPALLCFTR